MKRIKLKIFPKTLLNSLSLIIGIIVIAFFLINILTPRFYHAYKEDILYMDMDNLIASMESKKITEVIKRAEEFARNSEYGITLRDQNGDMLFSRLIKTDTEYIYLVDENAVNDGLSINIAGGASKDSINDERVFTDSDGHSLALSLFSSTQPVDEVSIVLLRVMPYALLISIILGAVVSFVYAKTITAPVKAISRATFNMRTLEKNAKCDVASSDEIGELANNINELYGRLLSTINDLQNEIQNVAAADKEKIDFMLTVSHELKTPLTAVKGMVVGMIHNVGVYKDRDAYLACCDESIDALTTLLNEILDASKLELSPSPDDYVDTNMRELVKDITATHEMIALSKQVKIDNSIGEDMNYLLPNRLFSKALSNIISNAVKYADISGTVSIYTDKEKFIVENSCEPLSPEEIRRVFEPFYSGGENRGHGLGLYLTERILKVCGLSFEFVPFNKGMRFIIFMK